jgi:hypothetical protein
MASRTLLVVALVVAIVAQAAAICQLRCFSRGEQSSVIARGPVHATAHSCHASAPTPADITLSAVDESCRHPSTITAVLATSPQLSLASSTSTPALIQASWSRAVVLAHQEPPRFGPPISSAGTLRI